MPLPLLLDGLLKDGFTLASLNHVVHLLLSGPLSSHNQRPPLDHFSAVTDTTVSGLESFAHLVQEDYLSDPKQASTQKESFHHAVTISCNLSSLLLI